MFQKTQVKSLPESTQKRIQHKAPGLGLDCSFREQKLRWTEATTFALGALLARVSCTLPESGVGHGY